MTTGIEETETTPGEFNQLPKPEGEEEEIPIENLTLNSNRETTSEPPEYTTLFPKIAGRIEELCDNLKFTTLRPTTISLSGTVKLHGTHADLVIYSDDTIRLQSRNRLSLDIVHDNYGVAASILPLRKETLELRNKFRERFLKLNRGKRIEDEFPMIIAGEWIGPGVQRSVAIEKLPRKYFVILSISINDSWLPNEGYGDICNESVGIYNISRGGMFSDILDLKDTGAFMERAMASTLEVEKECPFAKSFGVSGVGEGIVWKAEGPLGSSAKFWIKTKGPLHRVVDRESLKQAVAAKGKESAKAKAFAEAVVTAQRLDQAWDYLGEMEMARNKKGFSDFMRWLNNDVEVEEREAIVLQEVGGELRGRLEIIGVWKSVNNLFGIS